MIDPSSQVLLVVRQCRQHRIKYSAVNLNTLR